MAKRDEESWIPVELDSVQLHFADGDTYDGQAWNNLRHGRGAYRWRNGEVFDGYFYYDLMHGAGKYWWPDGHTFSGYFYANRRHGYGLLSLRDGDTLQGLFRDGVLYGPAIQSSPVEQDVGWWLGSHLIHVPSSMEKYLDSPYLQQVILLMPPKAAQVCKPWPHLKGADGEEVGEGDAAVKRYQLDGASLGQPHWPFMALLDAAFDKAVQRSPPPHADKVFGNNSGLLQTMQQYIWEMESLMEDVSRQVDDAFLAGRQGKFLPAGPKERQVELLFAACATGDLRLVHQLILHDKLNVDVCDRNGITPLMTATVNGQLDVMDLLLGFDADIHHESNSGYDAVELAFVMYHCFVEKFHGWSDGEPPTESVLGLPDKAAVIAAPSATAQTVNTKISTPKSALLQPAAVKTAPGESRLDQVEQKGAMDAYQSMQALKSVPINLPAHGFQRLGEQLYHLPSSMTKCTCISQEKPAPESALSLCWVKRWQHAMKDALLLLLKRGADWRRCTWPQAILFSAVRGLDVDVAQFLVDMGDNVNQRMNNKEGFAVTPLVVACGMMGNTAVEMVEVLLKAGADPNAPEVDTNPPKVQAVKKGGKGKKGTPLPAGDADAAQKGRRPIHVVFQRHVADPANEKLLEALIRYEATVDATWNNSSALASAVQLANVKMVTALLRVGCDVNRDLQGGRGNALCVLATLATVEGFVRCNKDALTIKAVMKMLLVSADFTLKIPLLEGPPGSPLDFASHLYTKQALGANMPAQLKDTLVDLRTSILEAYKEATQLSVLRHRKLTLAGTISPELQTLLRKYPQLIDGPDPTLKLKQEERALLAGVKDIRGKIASLMEEDVRKDGQTLRPTLKIPYEEAVRTRVMADASAQGKKHGLDISGLAAQVQSHLQVGDTMDQDHTDGGQRQAGGRLTDRKVTARKKLAAAEKDVQLPYGQSEAFLASEKEEWPMMEQVDSEGNIVPASSMVMSYTQRSVRIGVVEGQSSQLTATTQLYHPPHPGKKGAAFVGMKRHHVQHMVKAAGLLLPPTTHHGGKDKLRHSIIVHHPVYDKEGRALQLKEDDQVDNGPSCHHFGKKGRHYKVPHHDADHPNLLVPAVHLLDHEGDALPLDHQVMEYKYCSNCGRSTGIGLFPCPGCSALFYDSRDCQEAHWPLHRKRCAQIAQRKEHNDKVRKIVMEEKAQRQKMTPQGKAPVLTDGLARGHKRPLPHPLLSLSRKGRMAAARAGNKGGLGEGSSSTMTSRRPTLQGKATIKKARRPLVASGGALPQHLRPIDTATEKRQAGWMDRVRQLNRLQMDDEMACFVNNHYTWLVERGLNLAVARDLVEVKNGELYASIAFHRQVALSELIHYQEETGQLVPHLTERALLHKEAAVSSPILPLPLLTSTTAPAFPTTLAPNPIRLGTTAIAPVPVAGNVSPPKDLTTFFTYQDSKDANFAFT